MKTIRRVRKYPHMHMVRFEEYLLKNVFVYGPLP